LPALSMYDGKVSTFSRVISHSREQKSKEMVSAKAQKQIKFKQTDNIKERDGVKIRSKKEGEHIEFMKKPKILHRRVLENDNNVKKESILLEYEY
jgi:hypothetical protein